MRGDILNNIQEDLAMKTITMVTLISGLLASSLALADPHTDNYLKEGGRGCHHGARSGKMEGTKGMEGKGPYWEKMADRLKLTTEQRTLVKATVENAKPRLADLREKMRTNREALRELRQVGIGDESRLQALARERGNLVADLTIQRTQMRDDIRQILTDIQREQIKQMREEYRHEHRHKA
ncbi:protein refolding chaperone Spy/CpxP family [Nitrosospira sp. Nsp14]|uniref:Spy/CpxP family protein refolding chaperone n=1 Tax=Nitrosospira sp. Nsp14 TaxID=1855333 RepID=UPI0008EC3513|nr:Spy/CpxP family protein refolding chaperone [Nitrosospira sp. Nsp14]SFH42958.1 protein refolding chaperone Spy/CpxP family [Nitrosospira sp. Nsp14]